jgi:hypothetical protein
MNERLKSDSGREYPLWPGFVTRLVTIVEESIWRAGLKHSHAPYISGVSCFAVRRRRANDNGGREETLKWISSMFGPLC